MTCNSAFAWKNWCALTQDFTMVTGSFEDDAPVENLGTPQTGQLAISTGGTVAFRCRTGTTTPSGRPVGIVGLMNHNIYAIPQPNPGNLLVFLIQTESTNYEIQVNTFGLQRYGDFQHHLFVFLPDLAQQNLISVGVRVNASVICGRYDEDSGLFVDEPFSAGGIWASPLWRPERGIRFGSITQGVTENRRGSYSIGGQYYPQIMARRRTLSGTINLVDDLETQASANPTLQEMAAWSATSRPVVCIPDVTSRMTIATQALYGYFDEPLSWSHVTNGERFDEVTADMVANRFYSGGFGITEAL
jgi:hypothetical protein